MTSRWIGSGLFVVLLLAGGCGKPKEQPVLAKDVVDFTRLYGENCAGCHGKDGKNGAGLPLNNPLYLSLISKDALHEVVARGRMGTSMPAFAQEEGGPLNAKQVDAVVEGIEQNWAKPVDLQGSAVPPYSVAEGVGDAAHGQQIFQSVCASCHGEKGNAGPVTSAYYLQLVSNQWIRTSILAGHPETGMPDWRSVAAGHALSDQDISDVAAYVVSMRPGSKPTVPVQASQESGK